VGAFRDIGSALSWLTVITVPARDDVHPVKWFPLAGWLYAFVALAIAFGGTVLGDGHFGQFIIGWGIVGSWALLSRFLHWDGLADTADAVWGANDAKRRLDIMHDSRTGSFGVIAVMLVAIGQIIAVSAVFASGDWWALAAAPVLGRFAASTALWSIKPARPHGLAAHLAKAEGPVSWIVAFGLCAAVLLVPTPERLLLFVIGVTVALLGPRVISRTVGGVTGDVLGASVLLVETTVLVGAALMSGV